MLEAQHAKLSDSLKRYYITPPSGNEPDDLFSFINAKVIGHGGSGTVFEMDEWWVIKVFTDDEEGQTDLRREREIFDKLQSDVFSDEVVRFKEQKGSGLVLEHLETTLRQRLMQRPPSSKDDLATRWARQTCKGLAFLHQHGVIHGDIGCQNILLDSRDNAKICDFAGSKIGDKDAWISYEVRSQDPRYFGKQPTIKTEIFAFGSVLFELWTSRAPYFGEAATTVRQKFLDQQYPLSEIKDQKMGRIVEKCWTECYEHVLEIYKELEPLGMSP
jgi:serine/threonine protein kinase